MALLEALLEDADERDLTQARRVPRGRRLRGAREGARDDARAPDRGDVDANLRGRGGAGFPIGRKASLIPRDSPKPKYLVVNADESEPGAFKDRQVMDQVPHRLVEGCLIAAHAIESKDVFIYIRGEYLHEYEVLQAAVDEAEAAGLFDDVRVVVHRGAGAYICGEETALLDSLEGGAGSPGRGRRSRPCRASTTSPTQVNNVADDRDAPDRGQDGRGEVREDRRADRAGHRDLLDLGQRREPGELRARARDADARADLRPSPAASRTAGS